MGLPKIAECCTWLPLAVSWTLNGEEVHMLNHCFIQIGGHGMPVHLIVGGPSCWTPTIETIITYLMGSDYSKYPLSLPQHVATTSMAPSLSIAGGHRGGAFNHHTCILFL